MPIPKAQLEPRFIAVDANITVEQLRERVATREDPLRYVVVRLPEGGYSATYKLRVDPPAYLCPNLDCSRVLSEG